MMNTKFFLKSHKDAHQEKAFSNKTRTLTRSINLDIWSNQLFIRGSYTEIKF